MTSSRTLRKIYIAARFRVNILWAEQYSQIKARPNMLKIIHKLFQKSTNKWAWQERRENGIP
jgi:hypothetical protein